MTPSVTDKTPLSAKVWRRHSDPPGLWIAVVIGSVSLHLLAFWLMRSYQFSRLWQQNKAAIPIEVIEISSQTKPRARKVASKPKPVPPKPLSTTQKLRAANLPKQVLLKDKLTAKPAPPSVQERSAIAFTKNKKAIAEQLQRQQAEQLQRQQAEQLQRQQAKQLQRQQAEQLQRQQAEQLQRQQAEQLQRQQAEQLQRQQAEQLQRQQAEQLQRQQAEQLQRQQAEQLQRQQAEQLQRQQAEQRQRQQAEQLQRQQAEQLQRQQAEQRQRQQAEQLQRQQAEQRQRQQAEQLQRQQAEQLQRQQADQLQRQQADQLQRQQVEQLQRQQAEQLQRQQAEQLQPEQNAPSGNLLASLVGEPQQVERDRHNHPAKIKISDQPFPKGLEYVKFIENKPGQPVEFTVILTISEKGKLEKIDVEDEAVPEEERSYYEDFVADQVFKGWEFEPAYDNDPNEPKPSNLIVRIRIQPLP